MRSSGWMFGSSACFMPYWCAATGKLTGKDSTRFVAHSILTIAMSDGTDIEEATGLIVQRAAEVEENREEGC